MWQTLLPLVLGPLVGYVVDRWKYARTIAKAAEALLTARKLGDAPISPRELAEQAIIAANLREADRAAARLAELVKQGKREELEAIERGRDAAGRVTIVEVKKGK